MATEPMTVIISRHMSESVDPAHLEDLVLAYENARRLVDAMRTGTQKRLALEALETSFVHAVFADAQIESPIRMK